MQTENENTMYPLQYVCDTCEVPEHVLVYWSDYFRELKGAEGHLKAMFTERDLRLVQRIKKCLYSRFMTVQEASRVIAKEDSESSINCRGQTVADKTDSEEKDSSNFCPTMPIAPVFAASTAPEAMQQTTEENFSERISGGLKHLEEVLTEQKIRFEDSLTNQREEFSAVKSECAARLSDLTANLDCVKEKNNQLRRIVDKAVKDLEALRVDVFGDK